MTKSMLVLLTAVSLTFGVTPVALAEGAFGAPAPAMGDGQTEWVMHPAAQADTGAAVDGGFPVGRLFQGLMGLTGVVIFSLAGAQMTGLKSVSGTSVAESYYQSMGVFSFGMAALTGMLALQAVLPPEKP